MTNNVKQANHSIPQEMRMTISQRYKRITQAVNLEFWGINSDVAHSLYVGSYGRGTAVTTSDLDILIELPQEEYHRVSFLRGNGQSRLLQTVKNSIVNTYARTSIKADGQVVVVNFSDGMRFEILPAFCHLDMRGGWDGTYIYPNTHMGGHWLSTNPKAEQEAMKRKNSYDESNGLLFDTCKHIRNIHNEYFASYHLSGILIDTFVYHNIGSWCWPKCDCYRANAYTEQVGAYEQMLLYSYNMNIFGHPLLLAPGSGMAVISSIDWDVLGKVLKKMVT